MIEGGSSKTFTKIKKMMYTEPKTLHLLLDKLAVSIVEYLNAQIKAGVQSVVIFDTWGGVLTPRDYTEFSLDYLHYIVSNLIRENENRRVPVTIFTKNAGMWLEKIVEIGCDAIGLDWTINIADAKRRVGDRVVLQGNMDPSILYASPERIKQEVKTILKDFGKGGVGHIFNLGHGIHPDIPPDNVKVLVDAVHELSKPYHK